MMNKRSLLSILTVLFLSLNLSLNAQDTILKNKKQLIQEKNEEYMKHASLYDQYYKQKDYQSALPSWKLLYNKYPKSTKNIYLHGTAMYKSFIKKNKKNKEVRAKFLDTLMQIYDKRIKYFGQEALVLGKKGSDLFSYGRNKIENIEEALKIMSKSMEKSGNKTSYTVVNAFMQTTVKLYKSKKIEKGVVVEHNLKNNPKKVDKYQKVKDNVEQLFTDSGAADCEALIPFFEAKFEENKTDIELLKKITGMLSRAKCIDSELFSKTSEELYKLEPSALAAYNLAKLFYKKDNMDKTVEFYNKAIEGENDSLTKSNYLHELALISFGKLKTYPKAASYARQTIKFNPKSGKSYILIAKIYASASGSCGSSKLEKNAVFWVAVDKLIKAKSIDENVKEEANKLIRDYSKYFPNSEEAFFLNIKKGDTYKVACWINESTKVRFNK